MQLQPGNETSEWEKAQRAEVLGILLVVCGVLLALVDAQPYAGVGFAAVGAFLVAHTSAAYARSRGEVKAAAVRRPADAALPRGL